MSVWKAWSEHRGIAESIVNALFVICLFVLLLSSDDAVDLVFSVLCKQRNLS